MKNVSLVLFIVLSFSNSFASGEVSLREASDGLYWSVGYSEEEVLNKDGSRSPAKDNAEYKTVEELQGLVDVCWYRCTFKIERDEN